MGMIGMLPPLPPVVEGMIEVVYVGGSSGGTDIVVLRLSVSEPVTEG